MALSDNKEVVAKEGRLLSVKMKGSTQIYKGAMISINASGYAGPAAANETFIGMAYEEMNNADGDGDVEVRVIRDELHLVKGSGLAQSDMLADAFASDDENIIVTGETTEPRIGKVVEIVSATEAYVDITK